MAVKSRMSISPMRHRDHKDLLLMIQQPFILLRIL